MGEADKKAHGGIRILRLRNRGLETCRGISAAPVLDPMPRHWTDGSCVAYFIFLPYDGDRSTGAPKSRPVQMGLPLHTMQKAGKGPAMAAAAP